MILAIFMTANMAVSAMALARYDQRCRGVEASAAWQKYMDAHYGDEEISRIYPNAVRTQNDEKGEGQNEAIW